MLKQLLCLAIILFSSSCLILKESSQSFTGEQKMQGNLKHSYIDREGNVVIDASKYRGAGSFSEGLAAIQTEDYLTGFMDKSGKVVIRPQFYEAGHFSEGLAIVKTHEKSFFFPEDNLGYIDKTGQIVIKTDCDHLYDFSEGIAVGKKGNEFYLIDKTGAKTYFHNTNEIQLEFSGNQKFSDGLIVACDVKTQKCGFMDKSGKFVIEPKFENASSFSEGLARVLIVENQREKLGFINRKGEYVIPPKFDIDCNFLNSTDFSEELASLLDGPLTVDSEPYFMYIDKTGEVVLRTEFFRTEPFHEGLAAVYDADINSYGFINKSGEIAIPVQFSSVSNFSEGLAIVKF